MSTIKLVNGQLVKEVTVDEPVSVDDLQNELNLVTEKIQELGNLHAELTSELTQAQQISQAQPATDALADPAPADAPTDAQPTAEAAVNEQAPAVDPNTTTDPTVVPVTQG